jgi:hypothetical protein
MLKKIIWPNFHRIIELFTQKIVNKLSKIWVWDPGSEIRKKPIPDPRVKKAPDPGSATLQLKLAPGWTCNMTNAHLEMVCKRIDYGRHDDRQVRLAGVHHRMAG